MQLSKQTFEILKNFSEINNGILINPGNKLETISAMKNILANANVSETFETQFAIYDLTELLNLLSGDALLGAEYTFGEQSVRIIKERASANYFYADPSTVVAPTKDINFPEPDVTFKLIQSDLDLIKDKSGALGKFDVAVKSSDTDILLSVQDKKDVGSNTFDLIVGDNIDAENFTFYFKVENFKFIKGDYDVRISSEGISHFVHTELPIEYWVALEPDSIFEG